jgi:hypothetical protein
MDVLTSRAASSSGVSKAIRWSSEILQKEIGVLRNPVTRAGA